MEKGQKSLLTDFLRYVFATTTSLLVFSLYSMVDGLMVARGVGKYGMSAVNLAIPFTNALFSIGVLFAVGTSTVTAICLAQNKRQEANALFSQNLAVLTVIGLLITVLVSAFMEPFVQLLGADAMTRAHVTAYLRGLSPFSLCFLISYNLEVLIKTDGHPQLAMKTVIVGCLANCVMDYVAIFILKLGTFGAAAATGLSQLLTCVIYLTHFLRGNSTFHIGLFRFDWHALRRVLPIGFADGITELCTGLMIFLYNRTLLSTIGTDGVITYTVISYVNTIVVNLMVGISQGMQPLVSFHYGKSDQHACRTLLRYGMICAACFAMAVLVCVETAAPLIVQVFLKESGTALAAYSIRAFRIFSVSYLIIGFNVVAGGFLTALERPRPAICISIGRGLLVQSACLVTLVALLGGEGIWYTAIVSEGLCLIATLWLLRRNLSTLTDAPADR